MFLTIKHHYLLLFQALQERDKEHRNVVCSRLQYFLPSHPPISTASSNQLSNTAWPSFGLFDDGDDSGKSSKQSSRKSSAAMTAQSKFEFDFLWRITK